MPRDTAPVRLIALVQRPPNRYANQRFRLEQWLPHLEREHGITVHLAPFESADIAELMDKPGRRARKLAHALRDLLRRWNLRHDVARYHGAIVVHEAALLGGAWFERYLARHRVPFIYDFDDPLWITATEFGDWTTRFWRSPGKFAEICRLSSAVTVGNEYLASYARQYNADVTIVHTSIDLDRYRVLPRRSGGGPFTVVWTGQRGASMRFLDTVRPALERLGAKIPLRLRVISDEAPPRYENVSVEFVPWSPAVEANALGEGDVGIMPLPDTPATRGKCGLKALQYMAVGRATVVSPVGINRDLVRDGENGLWAESLEEWEAQLQRLARDEQLRDRLAAAGRKTVESGYTAQHSARAFADVVRRMLAVQSGPAGNG